MVPDDEGLAMKRDTPVIILCGGLGSRLGSETNNMPKPMIMIGDRPIIWHIMKIYAHHGYRKFVLALGYRADHIKDYFIHYKEKVSDCTVNIRTGAYKCLSCDGPEDMEVTLVDTGLETLKGGRIKRVERYIDTDDFLLTYSDGVADIDIGRLVRFHQKHGELGTVTGVNPPSRFGEILVDGDRIRSFSEKPQVSQGLINGGFFVFRRELFDSLSSDTGCDLEKGPLENLARDDRLRVYHHTGSWECMDTVRDYNHLNRLWAENKAFWKVWKD